MSGTQTQPTSPETSPPGTTQTSTSAPASPPSSETQTADDFVLQAFSQTEHFNEGDDNNNADSPPVQPAVVSPPAGSSPSTEQQAAPAAQPSSSPQPVQQTQQPPQGQPTAQSVAAPPAQTAQPVVPAAAPQEQPQTQQQSTPAATPQASFDQLAAEIDKSKDKFVDILAEHIYKMDDKLAEQLSVEPDKAVPKLLANAHVNIVQNVLRTVAQQIPAVVNGLLEARRVQTELEDKFYSKWPQLDRVKHDMTVRQLVAAYRQVNPQASTEDIMQMVGAQAILALNLTHTVVPPVQQAAPPVQPSAFRSAAATSAVSPAPPQQNVNPFAAMGDQLFAEDVA